MSFPAYLNKLLFSSMTVLLCACQGADKGTVIIEDNSSSSSILVASSLLRAGSLGCEFGGAQIDTGFDQNENGILDSSEVTETKIICNGTDGTNGTNGTNGATGANGLNSLIKIEDEEIGQNCSYGGKKIITGLDLNNDGLISQNEVGDTQYLCNVVLPTPAEQLCTVTDNPNGSATITCPDGTEATIANEGLDANQVNRFALCSGDLIGLSGFNWQFYVYEISNNYLFITATLWASDFEVSTSDIGFGNATSIFSADVVGNNNFGYWKYEMDTDSLLITLTYTDLDVTSGSAVWNFDSTDCTTFGY